MHPLLTLIIFVDNNLLTRAELCSRLSIEYPVGYVETRSVSNNSDRFILVVFHVIALASER